MRLYLRRREFIAALGGAAAWPLAANAQQPALPVVGWLGESREGEDYVVMPFRQGLKESGYIEHQNVAIEYRWADWQYNRLPALAAELVQRQVTVIVTGGLPSILAAKAATATIPIVFNLGGDPVELGIVASLNRPGGNLTGMTSLNVEIAPKQIELIHEVISATTDIALLVNPANRLQAERTTRDTQLAAQKLGLRLHVLNASTPDDFDMVFATLDQLHAGALVIGPDPLFTSGREQLGALTVRHAVPAICPYREFTQAGGLMSYGTDISSLFRQVGVYASRILKGDKPSELPVQRVTKLDLIINLKTAKTLGLTFPLTLRGRADEVIE